MGKYFLLSAVIEESQDSSRQSHDDLMLSICSLLLPTFRSNHSAPCDQLEFFSILPTYLSVSPPMTSTSVCLFLKQLLIVNMSRMGSIIAFLFIIVANMDLYVIDTHHRNSLCRAYCQGLSESVCCGGIGLWWTVPL